MQGPSRGTDRLDSRSSSIDDRLVHAALDRAAERWGDEPLITFGVARTGSLSTSYAALARDARSVAQTLLDAGLSSGDRVALMVSNRIEFLAVWFACAYAGLICVPLNTAQRGPLLGGLVESVDPALAFVEDKYVDQFIAAAPGQRVAERLVMVGDSVPPVGSGRLRYAAFLGRAGDSLTPPEKASTPHSIFFTSGTTGPAKGVVYSQARSAHLAANSNEWLQTERGDVVFTCLPLFHINALLNTFYNSMRVGCRCVIAEKFSASRFWDDVREIQATIVNCLGTMGAILWKQDPSPADTDHSVRRGLVMPCPVDWDEWRQRFGFDVLQCYGSTDAGSIMGIGRDVDAPKGSVGRVLDGWEVQIVDKDDRPVPVGTPGELLVRPTRPDIAMSGYWRRPDATVEAWRNLWLHTGDMLREDEDGNFWFVSRLSEFVRKAGENVSCFEVEQVITLHPDVELAMAFGIPAEMGDEEVGVLVVPRRVGELELDELREYCVEHLPLYAVPRYLGTIRTLPLTASGKVDRLAAMRGGRDLLVDMAPARGA